MDRLIPSRPRPHQSRRALILYSVAARAASAVSNSQRNLHAQGSVVPLVAAALPAGRRGPVAGRCCMKTLRGGGALLVTLRRSHTTGMAEDPVRLEFPILSLTPGLGTVAWRLTSARRGLAHEGPPAHPASPGRHDREAVWPRWRASGDRGAFSAQAACASRIPNSLAASRIEATLRRAQRSRSRSVRRNLEGRYSCLRTSIPADQWPLRGLSAGAEQAVIWLLWRRLRPIPPEALAGQRARRDPDPARESRPEARRRRRRRG